MSSHVLYILVFSRCKLVSHAFDSNLYELVLIVAVYAFSKIIAKVRVLSYLQIFPNEIRFPHFRMNPPKSIVVEIIS